MSPTLEDPSDPFHIDLSFRDVERQGDHIFLRRVDLETVEL